MRPLVEKVCDQYERGLISALELYDEIAIVIAQARRRDVVVDKLNRAGWTINPDGPLEFLEDAYRRLNEAHAEWEKRTLSQLEIDQYN